KRVSERERATNPQPMNDHATIRFAAAVNAGVVSWLLRKTSDSPIPVKTSAVARTSQRARDIALSKHSFERSARELGLRNETACAALVDERAEVGSIPARSEDDERPGAVPG